MAKPREGAETDPVLAKADSPQVPKGEWLQASPSNSRDGRDVYNGHISIYDSIGSARSSSPPYLTPCFL